MRPPLTIDRAERRSSHGDPDPPTGEAMLAAKSDTACHVFAAVLPALGQPGHAEQAGDPLDGRAGVSWS
ncbi:hypothetical protein ACWEPC_46670 [Nonomuraea sp. NPDC004297]